MVRPGLSRHTREVHVMSFGRSASVSVGAVLAV
jgi:hypothetical protein